jgi:hypothetical protein
MPSPTRISCTMLLTSMSQKLVLYMPKIMLEYFQNLSTVAIIF